MGEPLTREGFDNWAKAAKPDVAWSLAAELDLPVLPRQLSYQDRFGITRALSDEELYEVVRTTGPDIRRLLQSAAPEIGGRVAEVQAELVREGVPAPDALQQAREHVRSGLVREINGLRAEAKERVVRR
jgi:hypothetical protein